MNIFMHKEVREVMELIELLGKVTGGEQEKKDVLQIAITLAQLGVTPDDTESLVRTWHIARYASVCSREEFNRVHDVTRRIIDAAGGWSLESNA